MWMPKLFEQFSQAEVSGVSVCSWGNKSDDFGPSENKLCYPSAEVYRNGLITSLACLPGNLISVVLVDHVGRKPLLGNYNFYQNSI